MSSVKSHIVEQSKCCDRLIGHSTCCKIFIHPYIVFCFLTNSMCARIFPFLLWLPGCFMRESLFQRSVMQIVVLLVTTLHVSLSTSIAYPSHLSSQPPNLTPLPVLSSTITLRKPFAVMLELCSKVPSVAQGSALSVCFVPLFIEWEWKRLREKIEGFD